MKLSRPGFSRVAVVLIGALLLFRLWTSLCFFYLPEWNVTRLAPVFMLAEGYSPYPGLGGGALTTWIYGPVPLVLWLPSTLAKGLVGALSIAGLVNLLCCLFPLGWCVWSLRRNSPAASGIGLFGFFALCFSLWPNSALHYLQSDNVAVAFAFLSNLLLWGSARSGYFGFVAAALCAALAVWSKQIYCAIILAQLLWLAMARGLRPAFFYGLLCLALSTLLGALFGLKFGPGALYLNLVAVPGAIPFCEDYVARCGLAWKELLLAVVLPALGLLYFWRVIWQRTSLWLLPALCWLCFLPLGGLAFLKYGGATNALYGYLFLIVPAASALSAFVVRKFQEGAGVWLALVVLPLLFFQLGTAPWLPLRPMTTHLEEAEDLARAFPQRVYFPWNPLVTWFSDHQFYHAEDGLHTRALAGLGVDGLSGSSNLPSQWCMTAVPGWRTEGQYKRLQPREVQETQHGKWTLYIWRLPRPSSVSDDRVLPAKVP